MLSFKEIKELIDLVSQRGLAGLEIERTGFRLRIEGSRPAGGNGAGELSPAAGTAPQAVLAPGASAAAGEAAKEAENVHVITSPIVGTFYRSPSPEAGAFAEVGERVARGKVLCIIESMKLMNEIESDVEGEIVAVYARNGQPVEYGEKLFGIKLAA
jgi:acetyl-CoA carboxylase biotin carboxyl carrier protein